MLVLQECWKRRHRPPEPFHTAAEIIAKLVELARELRKAEVRGKGLRLSDEEMDFYDAVSEGPEKVLDDTQLRTIARGAGWLRQEESEYRLGPLLRMSKPRYVPPSGGSYVDTNSPRPNVTR